jgi:hypothetical protein
VSGGGLLMQFDVTYLTHHTVLAFITPITCGEIKYEGSPDPVHPAVISFLVKQPFSFFFP